MALVDRVILTPFVTKLIGKYGYALQTRLLGDQNVFFINFSYEEDPPMTIPLSAEDEPNRSCIQLYHRTAAQTDIEGKDVLEVSCGHGGGAAYLARTFHPASYTGLDLNSAGIEFCRTKHVADGLSFVHGDAEQLPFPDESFDVVINVEAGHLYPHFRTFLAEVSRVLRPGGYFLHTDLRPKPHIAEWEKALSDCPLQQVSCRVINDEVMRGMRTNTTDADNLTDRYLPKFLRGLGRLYAPGEGSRMYRALESGDYSYRMYSFVKNQRPPALTDTLLGIGEV